MNIAVRNMTKAISTLDPHVTANCDEAVQRMKTFLQILTDKILISFKIAEKFNITI